MERNKGIFVCGFGDRVHSGFDSHCEKGTRTALERVMRESMSQPRIDM